MSVFNILFLGTGAADWEYHPVNRYDTSKTLRRTSSVLVNERILIDPAPEAFFFAKNVLNVNVLNVTDILLTHTHNDHFNLESLQGFLAESSGKVRLHCHKSCLAWLKEQTALCDKIELHPLETGKIEEIGGIHVLPLKANHEVVETRETVLHYILISGDKSWLYGCDGGWFCAETWSCLMNRNLNLAILDGTVGELPYDFRIGTHNTLPMLRLLVPAMYQNQVLAQDGQVVLSHLARTLHSQEENLAGMYCAYDGMNLML